MPIRTMLKRHAEQAEFTRQDADLAGNLAGRQVAHEPHPSRQAERALHRAADLRGHAESLARRVGDIHGFDVTAVGQLKPELLRAVG